MDRELEDDVKRCNELIKVEHANWIGISNQLAISHILAELEQKDKRIQELEEERQLVGIPVRNKRDRRIGIVLHQWENGSVAVLERINPRIINTHDSWNTLEIITDEVNQVQTQDDSIPKQVAIDKIEENSNIVKEIEEKIKEEENFGDICREYIRDLKRQKGLVKKRYINFTRAFRRREIEMCEYCKKRKKLKSNNFCGSATLIVSGNILVIYGDEKKFNIFKRIYRPRFDINYCPMCGRRLGE